LTDDLRLVVCSRNEGDRVETASVHHVPLGGASPPFFSRCAVSVVAVCRLARGAARLPVIGSSFLLDPPTVKPDTYADLPGASRFPAFTPRTYVKGDRLYFVEWLENVADQIPLAENSVYYLRPDLFAVVSWLPCWPSFFPACGVRRRVRSNCYSGGYPAGGPRPRRRDHGRIPTRVRFRTRLFDPNPVS